MMECDQPRGEGPMGTLVRAWELMTLSGLNKS
jgi:hypothetical protein